MPLFDEKGRLILRHPAIEQRYKEAKEWKKKLPKIYKATCKKIKAPESCIDIKEYDIEYDPKFQLWAAVSLTKKKIYLGQKWYHLSDEEKEKVLMHELTHATTGRRKHTQPLKGFMRGAGIPATFRDIEEGRKK